MNWHLRPGYIDPVSGSILIQTILAAVAGGLAFFRKSLWDLVRGRKHGKPDGSPPAAGPGDHRDE